VTPTSRNASRTSAGSRAGPDRRGESPEQRGPGLSRRRVWWLAARPATLAASVSPVLAGTAVAAHDGHVRTLPGLGALVVAVAMQVGVNYANDYADFVRGTDTPARVGPLRAAASGLVKPAHVRAAALAAFGVAAAAGLAVGLATDWRLVLIGALAVLAGWLYTGGPRPYGYVGLGEVFVFCFFGLFATVGTTYVHELQAPPAAWAAGCATGALACAILAINNLRDVETDAAAGKRTLAVRFGRAWTRALVGACFAVALAAPVLAAVVGWAPRAAVLPVLTLPAVLVVLRATASREPPVLIRALRRTAVTEVWWALLWTLGVLL
jgi:1,4-dihydroxy-2-naphthoate octaprenyltransferase